MTEQVFQPRIAPRDISDTILSAGIGLLQVGVLFGLPALICFWIAGSVVLASAVACALYAIFILLCVTNLKISPAGIRLSRAFGGPKFIAWSDIACVEEVPRSELIWRGWVWPLFPPREMTPSLTSLGHYRIQYGSESVYFPPADPQAFMAAVRTHMTAGAKD
ncbi:MAG: hypothetical protein V4484_16455 [Pseudomonadota bacterium]